MSQRCIDCLWYSPTFNYYTEEKVFDCIAEDEMTFKPIKEATKFNKCPKYRYNEQANYRRKLERITHENNK